MEKTLSAKVPANLRLVTDTGPDIVVADVEFEEHDIVEHEPTAVDASRWSRNDIFWPGPRLEWPAGPNLGLDPTWPHGARLDSKRFRVLLEFVDLTKSTKPVRILRFAQKYGMLGIGRYGGARFTGSSDLDEPSGWDALSYRESNMLPDGHVFCYETLDQWWRYARGFQAFLSAYNRVRNGEAIPLNGWGITELGNAETEFHDLIVGEDSQWDRLMEAALPELGDERLFNRRNNQAIDTSRLLDERLPAAQRLVFAKYLTLLMQHVGLQPWLTFEPGAGSPLYGLRLGVLKPAPVVLLPFLVEQLVTLLMSQGTASEDVLTECSICQKMYLAGRRPRTRRRGDDRPPFNHYCSDKCRAEGQLVSKRASYHRNSDRWPSSRKRRHAE